MQSIEENVDNLLEGNDYPMFPLHMCTKNLEEVHLLQTMNSFELGIFYYIIGTQDKKFSSSLIFHGLSILSRYVFNTLEYDDLIYIRKAHYAYGTPIINITSNTHIKHKFISD